MLAGFGHRSAVAPIGLVRRWFYYVYLACLLGANTVLLLPARGFDEAGSSTPFIASWVVLYALTLLLLLTRLRSNPTNLAICLLFSSYVVASTVWSAVPSTSLTYGGMLACNFIAAYLLSVDFTLVETVRMVGRVILVLSILGVLAYFAGYVGAYYYDAHSRPNFLGGQPFRGLFPHKILAGLYASIGAICFLWSSRGIKRTLALLVFLLVVLLSGSATGLLMLIAGIALYGLTYMSHARGVRPSAFFGLVLSVTATGCVVVLLGWTDILAGLGRDATLTGRTLLWQWGINAWLERPILGWGFKAYLETTESLQINAVIASFRNYDVPHFHQAYIQTAVDLGFVGLIALLGVIIYATAASYRLAFHGQDSSAIAVFAMIGTFVVASMAVFVYVNYNNFVTTMLLALFFRLRAEMSTESMASFRPAGRGAQALLR